MLLPRNQHLVFVMWSDPKPHKIAVCVKRNRTVAGADAGGPEAADAFQLERWMAGILLEEREVLVGDCPDISRQ